MTIISSLRRGSGLLIALALSIALPLTPNVGMSRLAVAYAAPRAIHIAGQITAVSGPSDNPTGFVLQMPARSLNLRILKKTSITARSAEALVEGLGPNDFAQV